MKLIILFLVLFFVGIWRVGYSQILPKDDISKFHGMKAEIIGWVCEDPDERVGSMKLTICADEIGVGGKKEKVSGKILVSVKLYPKYEYGDTIRIIGKLEKPKNFDNFAYDKYLSRYNIYSVIYYPQAQVLSHARGNSVYSAILRFKNFVKEKIDLSVPEPQASIINAFFLGTRGGIPDDINQAFKASGIIHLIAISGSHITLIMVMMETLLPFFYIPRKKAFYVICAIIAVYVALIGAPASAVRAAIMGAAILFAKKIGRLSKSLNILLFTGSMMLLQNSKLLFDDIGFQLSFLALWGIIEFIPRWEEKFSSWPDFFGLKSMMFMTLASQIATFPVLAYNFKMLSLIAPITNIFVLPLFTFFMGITLVSIAITFFISSFSVWIFFIPYILVSYIMGAAQFFSKIPFAYIPLENFSFEVMIVSFFLIFYFTYQGFSKTKHDENIKKDTGILMPIFKYSSLAVFVIFFVFIISPYVFSKTKTSRIAIFFDIGQGDAAFLRTKSGKTALIDGGPDNAVLYKVGKYLPFWEKNINTIIITHPHADHMTGIVEILRRYSVSQIIMNDSRVTTLESQALEKMISKRNVTVHYIRSKKDMEFDSDMILKFLYPQKSFSATTTDSMNLNDTSIVFQAVWGETKLLFMGDLEKDAQNDIIGEDIKSQIIKVAHHGSEDSLNKNFLSRVSSEYSIISVGENTYGHPSLRVIRELERLGSKVFTTKASSDVMFQFDEKDISIATQL